MADRTKWQIAADTIKPKLGNIVKDSGGNVALAIPILGEILRITMRILGADSVLYAAGAMNLPRKWFGKGPAGDAICDLANEMFDELGQSIAAHGPDGASDHIITEIVNRIRGKITGAETTGGKPKMDDDPKAVVDAEHDDPMDFTTDIVQRNYHHPSCADVLRTIPTAGTGRRAGTIVTKPNPDLREMPLSHAVAQGFVRHDVCCQIFDDEKKKAAAAAAPTAKRKTVRQLFQEIDVVKQTDISDWLNGESWEVQQRFWHSNQFATKEQLTNFANLMDTEKTLVLEQNLVIDGIAMIGREIKTGAIAAGTAIRQMRTDAEMVPAKIKAVGDDLKANAATGNPWEGWEAGRAAAKAEQATLPWYKRWIGLK